jgi:hypothetical protein
VTVRPIVLAPPLPLMPGVIIGGDPARDVLAHCCFVDRDIDDSWPAVSERVTRAAGQPGATLLLVAPFVPTVAGTDTYLDEIW